MSFKFAFSINAFFPLMWHHSEDENPIISTKSFLKFSLIIALEQDYKEIVLH